MKMVKVQLLRGLMNFNGHPFVMLKPRKIQQKNSAAQLLQERNAKQQQIFRTPLRTRLLSRGLMNLMGSAQNREKFCCTIAARKKCKTTTDFQDPIKGLLVVKGPYESNG